MPAMKMSAYEPGMEIAFDPEARKVTVAFRGRVTTFPTMLENEADARMAAEAYCRELGWNPKPRPAHPRS
jgi:hypothetical protein